MNAALPSNIQWPRGGLQWHDRWLQRLPVVRGVHTPPFAKPQLLAQPMQLPERFHPSAAHYFAELARAAEREWCWLDAQQWGERVTREVLAAADAEHWMHLYAQALHTYELSLIPQLTYQACVLHGPACLLGIALELAAMRVKVGFPPRPGELGVLRQAIALADDAAYRAAHALAEHERHRSDTARLICAHLFPHLEAWTIDCLERGIWDDGSMLGACVMPVSIARAQFEVWGRLLHHYRHFEGAVLLQLRLHGHAAFELLELLFARSGSSDNTVKVLDLIGSMHTPQALQLLVRQMEMREVIPVLDAMASLYPAAALYLCIERALATHSPVVQGWAVRLALRDAEARASALAALSAAQRARFESFLTVRSDAEAALESLPSVLRDPPWLHRQRAVRLPTLPTTPFASPERIRWDAEQRAEYEQHTVGMWTVGNAPSDATERQHFLLDRIGVRKQAHARVLAGESLREDDLYPHLSGEFCDVLLLLPVPAALSLWNSYPTHHWLKHELGKIARCMLARHDLAALPGFIAYVRQRPEGMRIARGIDSQRLVPLALHALRNSKLVKRFAAEWIQEYPRTTLLAALPQAFGSDKKLRDDAANGVRWLAENGHAPQIRDIADDYGEAMAAGVTALLGTDRLLMLPARMPQLPRFFVAAACARPRLKDGGALPLAAVEHLGHMLAISKLEQPYAGLDIVKQACTPESLADFAWDVFEAWLTSGAPSKESWAFTALGLLGDDTTARRLAPKIREWPGASAHQRAVTGLDALAAIGSDVALMHLHGIATKVKFKALQDRAREKIAAMAESRGLSAAELGDRAVPDLGLDANGELLLDFGPRQFHAGIDQSLQAFVKDSEGAQLADLPKPLPSDDAKLARAARERFEQLQRNVKLIVMLQVVRLEQAMVSRRRWSEPEFRHLFLEHPVSRQLAARLVWGVYVGDTLRNALRIAEDATLADRSDSHFELDPAATIGIAHALEMSPELRTAFSQIFADYEILQPFEQLGRATYVATPQELAASSIARFQGKRVLTASVLGLASRDWRSSSTQDDGWTGSVAKPLGDQVLELMLDPGIVVGDTSHRLQQQLLALQLRWRDPQRRDPIRFAQADPIALSEALRDIDLLVPVD